MEHNFSNNGANCRNNLLNQFLFNATKISNKSDYFSKKNKKIRNNNFVISSIRIQNNPFYFILTYIYLFKLIFLHKI